MKMLKEDMLHPLLPQNVQNNIPLHGHMRNIISVH